MIARLAARRLLLRNSYLALACAALLAAAPAPVRAQQAEIDALAARLAEQIAKSHMKKVVVVDLMGSDDKPQPLGAWLSDQLSVALAKVASRLEVVGRAQLKEALEKRKLSTGHVSDPKIARFLRKSLGAQVVVTGSFGRAEDNVGISLAVSKVSEHAEMLSQIDGKIPMTKEMEALLQEPTQGLPPADGIYKPGQGGVAIPTCVHCPSPNYSEEQRSRGVGGTVVLEVIITPEGRATGITIKKSGSPALDQRAVEVVRTWKFKPATGPDGRPVPVRITIEITLRLLK